MGWKALKDHYRIGHIVRVEEDAICIGSPYIHNLITVNPKTGTPTWGVLGRSRTNDDLCRYFDEMEADPAKVLALLAEQDQFSASLPVYTYEGANIIEKRCEAYDWPNCTHDGAVMYENTFSPDRAKVIRWAKSNAEAAMKSMARQVVEAEKNLAQRKAWHAEHVADLARLNADFPDINPDTEDDA